MNIRKSEIGEELCSESSPPEDVQGVQNNTSGKPTDSHRYTTIRFANCNKGDENTARNRPNKYDEILQGRKLEEFLNDTWNDRWLETEKGQWTHEIYPDLRSRKEVDHNPMPEMVRFLTGHGSFAAKLAQMNLKESDKCSCAQTTKHLWNTTRQRQTQRIPTSCKRDGKETKGRRISVQNQKCGQLIRTMKSRFLVGWNPTLPKSARVGLPID